jgi:alpha-beta hydrolase superfamily lysophospholipase
MQASTFTLATPDGIQLHVHRWLPDGADGSGGSPSPAPVKAVVQVAHGMAEHSARYARFAERLTAAGYAVYANDHRGHGDTARTPADAGYLADHNGFSAVVDDLRLVGDHARAEHPGRPFFLFGHSMGSFLSRAYAARYGTDLDGLVLSGTAGDPGVLGQVGRALAIAQGRLRGRRHTSGLMDQLTFGQYGAAFKPNRTKFDWLSRDEAEVDLYVADEQCGNVFTSGFFADLLGGLADINTDRTASRVPKDLPIYLVSGSMDPVGNMTKGVQQVAEQYRRVGVAEVTTRFWPEGRHEVLNETNRDEVMADFVAWFDAHLPAPD